MDEILYNTYSQTGGGNLPVFAGSRRHLVGGGFFSTLARFGIPLLKNICKRLLGATARGATEYLSGNKGLGEAMVGQIGDEAIDLAQEGVKRGAAAFRKRKQRGGGGGGKKKKKKKKSISHINKKSGADKLGRK